MLWVSVSGSTFRLVGVGARVEPAGLPAPLSICGLARAAWLACSPAAGRAPSAGPVQINPQGERRRSRHGVMGRHRLLADPHGIAINGACRVIQPPVVTHWLGLSHWRGAGHRWTSTLARSQGNGSSPTQASSPSRRWSRTHGWQPAAAETHRSLIGNQSWPRSSCWTSSVGSHPLAGSPGADPADSAWPRGWPWRSKFLVVIQKAPPIPDQSQPGL